MMHLSGDLKPDNVLLKFVCCSPATSRSGYQLIAKVRMHNPYGPCKDFQHSEFLKIIQVADFGLSMNAGFGSHVSGVKHGTPLYMAPEILIDAKASKAADV